LFLLRIGMVWTFVAATAAGLVLYAFGVNP
jgi:hypothetical protein